MKTVALLAAAQLVSAHFGIEYPEWRADSLSNDEYSQWNYPCAGVAADAGNRTDWPLTGGPLKLDLHHPWTYVFVNLGLGDNVTNFNYTLTPEFLNTTGKGTLCLPEVPLPADLKVQDGDKASLQVVTLGESGSALYNCADITFRAKVDVPKCTAEENVTYVAVKEQNGNGSSADNGDGSSSGGSSNSTGGGSDGTSAGTIAGVSKVALSSAVALAIAFGIGMSM